MTQPGQPNSCEACNHSQSPTGSAPGPVSPDAPRPVHTNRQLRIAAGLLGLAVISDLGGAANVLSTAGSKLFASGSSDPSSVSASVIPIHHAPEPVTQPEATHEATSESVPATKKTKYKLGVNCKGNTKLTLLNNEFRESSLFGPARQVIDIACQDNRGKFHAPESVADSSAANPDYTLSIRYTGDPEKEAIKEEHYILRPIGMGQVTLEHFGEVTNVAISTPN